MVEQLQSRLTTTKSTQEKREQAKVLKRITKRPTRKQIAEIDPKYREAVIDYLVQKELQAEDRVLTKRIYCKEKELDYATFLKLFNEISESVIDQARFRLREAKESRLQQLRASPPTPPKGNKLPASSQTKEILALEKIAKKKLPVRKGVVIFSADQEENRELEDMWVEIANDVSKVGLIDEVARKWEHALALPVKLPEDLRLRLILLRIQTILNQLEVFTPPPGLPTFKTLFEWRHPKRPTLTESITSKKPPTLVEEPTLSKPKSEEAVYTEEWLEQELAREEAEKRRWLDTPEERESRRSQSLVIPAPIAQQFNRRQIERLKEEGALYDKGDWLVVSKEDLNKWLQPMSQEPRIVRKPKLLVAIGEQDYIKDWMREAFDVKTVRDPGTVHATILSFRPDSLMIYKSDRKSVV